MNTFVKTYSSASIFISSLTTDFVYFIVIPIAAFILYFLLRIDL